jgi:uncharacterized protein YndB with AHSA1/START domain
MEVPMPAPAVHDTFVIKRTYPHSPERLYAALSDPQIKARWYSAERTGVMRFELDFRVGGVERQHYTLGDDTPFPGAAIDNEGRIEDIVPGERIVLTSTTTFAEKRISSALITYEVAEADGGSRLTLTHQAVFYDGADGAEMRRQGWETLLDVLGRSLAS